MYSTLDVMRANWVGSVSSTQLVSMCGGLASGGGAVDSWVWRHRVLVADQNQGWTQA
jgi:hypothetical protein